MSTKKVQRSTNSKRHPVKKQVSLAYHIAKSLTALSSHSVTGKVVHPRHTSHGVLIGILLVAGIALFSNLGMFRAYTYALTSAGSVSIGLTVNGQPPIAGAYITIPTNNSVVSSSVLDVRGTCPSTVLVAIYDNGAFVGSAVCDSNGAYVIPISLEPGTNILQAQDYDGLNQPGPTTAQITVTYPVVITTGSTGQAVITVIPVEQVPIVSHPAPQPSVNPCYDAASTDAIKRTDLALQVSCIIRNVFAGQSVAVPITIVNGVPPYALTVEWGDSITDLRSFAQAGRSIWLHTYQTSGFHTLKMQVSDALGTKTTLQTVMSVNGDPAITSTTTKPVATIINNVKNLWVEAPVPLYIAAVTLTLGFWVGDIFNRRFGTINTKKTIKSLKKRV
jgi:hypothetical protein